MRHLVEIVIMLLGSAAIGYLLRYIRDRAVRDELRAAREQNERFKTQLIEADGEKSALTANARQAQAEAERLRRQLADAERRLEGPEQVLAPVAEEIAALRRRQEAAEAEMADLRRALAGIRTAAERAAERADEPMAPALSPVELAGVAASLAPAVAAAVAAHLPHPALIALDGGVRPPRPEPSVEPVAPSVPPPGPPVPPPPPAPPQEAGDDLTVLSGLDPRLAAVLKAAGVKTWKSIGEKSADDLRAMLDAAGATGVDASTWPEQARLAAGGHWAQLRALQRNRR